MTPAEALEKARQIVVGARQQEPDQLGVTNFGKYAELVSYILLNEWTSKQRESTKWLPEFAKTWRFLADTFDKEVKADPMILYRAAHSVAIDFHSSKAFIRYFRAGNRTSKTQSGYAEHYFVLTGQHPWRYFPKAPNNTMLVSHEFTAYEDGVFKRKMFLGEEDNPYAPMFPEDGKWFNRWDSRTHTLTIGCPDCAAKGRARSCRHAKSSTKLFSSEGGVGVIEGFVVRLAHIDEHVPEEFYTAVKQRLMSASHSSLIVTGTPLHGLESWETQRLAMRAEGNRDLNRMDVDDPKSPPYVSLHQISQFDAGIVPHWKIKAEMASMDEFEIEARIYGRPAPLAKNPVFSRTALTESKKFVRPPRFVNLTPKIGLVELLLPEELEVTEVLDSNYRVWEDPYPGATYIIGADSAAGLSGKDPSCATVLKLIPQSDGRLRLKMVAQYHGWVNVLDYGAELKKLGTYYNQATIIIELTGGHGQATMQRLRKDLYYQNIFRDTTAPAVSSAGLQGRMGIDTNKSTKPLMIGALQQVIKDGLLDIPCKDTIGELVAYEQERSERGYEVHYRGAGGSHDDRVMALALAVYVALTNPTVYFLANSTPPTVQSKRDPVWDEIQAGVMANSNPSPFDIY